MSANTAWPGSEMSSSERAIGRAAARIWRSNGNTLSIHQRATSGNDSSRSVSPVGAQSTMITSHSPGFVVRLQPQQREQLVHARRDGQLLGRDPVDAALDEQLAQPLLHAGPVALHLLLGLDLLAPQAVADLDRLGAQLDPQRLGQAVRRIGGDDQRPQAAGGAAARGAGGDRGLADAALAGVEDRPRAPHRRESKPPPRSGALARSARDLQVPGDPREVAGQVGRGEDHRRRCPAFLIRGTVKLRAP